MAFHALQLLFRLAHQNDASPMSASELADNSAISEHFIQKIMRNLQISGLVRSIRGIAGGFVLNRAPQEISLSDIIVALEGGINLPEVKENFFAGEAVLKVWSEASNRILRDLRAITLMDVFDQIKKEGQSEEIPKPPTKDLRRPLGRIRCRRPRGKRQTFHNRPYQE